jgi:hypothetical protein
MSIRRLVLVGVLALVLAPPAHAGRTELASMLAARLLAKKSLTPRTHTTDFSIDQLGCITLTRRELRAFGFIGHAFVCEEPQSGAVLGAVLTRRGVVRCHISGWYAGDACYDLAICGDPETACVR